ncbi:hypothetical protein [Bosea sp. 124]|uniref:hypothetical protein n=1 Tax=Bosea sp. 124 TaxID=2135642 RepID=UPI000D35F830|nr:hypothetical protein [Bosea sp. 124]
MKQPIAALAILAALAACAPPPRSLVDETPRAVPSKRITVVGRDVTLPDGSRATMDSTGGFLLPNGERVMRDARGALVLPNGNRCLPDGGGFVCP